MEKEIHYLDVSTFSKEDEKELTESALEYVLPNGVECDCEKLAPEEEGGVFSNWILSYKVRLKRNAQIKDILTKLLGGLDQYDRKKISDGIENYVDESGTLYLRISKREAAEKQIVLESKDSIHLSIKLAIYPANLENAIKAAKKLIENGLC